MFEGFTQQQIQANGVTLNVRTKGRGPAVVLLHGYPANSCDVGRDCA